MSAIVWVDQKLSPLNATTGLKLNDTYIHNYIQHTFMIKK